MNPIKNAASDQTNVKQIVELIYLLFLFDSSFIYMGKGYPKFQYLINSQNNLQLGLDLLTPSYF